MKSKIFISGDFCPINSVLDAILNSVDKRDFFGEILHDINDADISITNLECPLTTDNNNKTIKKKGIALSGDIRTATFLKESGFNLITLANNHILDFGIDGLTSTFNALDSARLDRVGAGLDCQEADKPYINDNLAIINAAENEFSSSILNDIGANGIDLISLYYEIKKLKKDGFWVVLILHGGKEHSFYPSPQTVRRYRFLIDAGADAIVAHHTHSIGGYEVYHGRPIFYSLGNFVFQSKSPEPDSFYYGYAVNLYVGEEIEFDIVPYKQCLGKIGVTKLKDQECEDFIKKIDSINLVINSPEQLIEKWQKVNSIQSPSNYLWLRYSSIPMIIKRILYKLVRILHLPKSFLRLPSDVLLSIIAGTYAEIHNESLRYMLKKEYKERNND